MAVKMVRVRIVLIAFLCYSFHSLICLFRVPEDCLIYKKIQEAEQNSSSTAFIRLLALLWHSTTSYKFVNIDQQVEEKIFK
jgi:hypothetical protein